MAFLSALGEFPEMVLGLAFSLGFALLLGFVCLRLLLGLITRQRYNVTHNVINDPSHVASLLHLGSAVARTDAGSNGDGGSLATGGPYLLPAASPHNRFVRDAKSDAAPGARVVELPVPVAGGAAQSWSGDGGDAA